MSLERLVRIDRVAAGEPITTAEVAAGLRISSSAASQTLRLLAENGLAHRLRPGLWLIGTNRIDRFRLASAVAAPFPAYVSFTSALNFHGLIDQLPREIAVASPGRPRVVVTSSGTFRLHRIPAALFDGWTEMTGALIASPEKAIFDLAYVAAVRGVPANVPELELPKQFDRRALDRWLARIATKRLRTLTRRQLDAILARAVR